MGGRRGTVDQNVKIWTTVGVGGGYSTDRSRLCISLFACFSGFFFSSTFPVPFLVSFVSFIFAFLFCFAQLFQIFFCLFHSSFNPLLCDFKCIEEIWLTNRLLNIDSFKYHILFHQCHKANFGNSYIKIDFESEFYYNLPLDICTVNVRNPN